MRERENIKSNMRTWRDGVKAEWLSSRQGLNIRSDEHKALRFGACALKLVRARAAAARSTHPNERDTSDPVARVVSLGIPTCDLARRWGMLGE